MAKTMLIHHHYETIVTRKPSLRRNHLHYEPYLLQNTPYQPISTTTALLTSAAADALDAAMVNEILYHLYYITRDTIQSLLHNLYYIAADALDAAMANKILYHLYYIIFTT